MHLKLLNIKQSFLDNDIFLPLEILQLFLDILILKFSWWSLKDNYLLYYKQYFDIFVCWENDIVLGNLYESNPMARGIVDSMSIEDRWYTLPIDMSRINEKFIAISMNKYSDCKTFEIAKTTAWELSGEPYKHENGLTQNGCYSIAIDLSTFKVTTLMDTGKFDHRTRITM